ncbi:hypothetical protein [Salipiger mucosus]|uniref:Uncharacterized protein n=1 Tax=Salipiger mucosus DSM 16094 TaxID=1123237 RepID=S9RS00_9RHOB|nr:hypothetical protein [Salipiger mucosus]EPX76744.1 hypothetical protein Salmuc_04629 [Salipiger mucosus DSM 16094]
MSYDVQKVHRETGTKEVDDEDRDIEDLEQALEVARDARQWTDGAFDIVVVSDQGDEVYEIEGDAPAPSGP